jgi:tetratricopeptide (TPR) repeat protein
MNNTAPNLKQAIDAINNKEYPRAREILKVLINSDPNDVNAWILYARVAVNREQAVECLERVLLLDPGNRAGLKMMAMLRPPQNPVVVPQPDETTPASITQTKPQTPHSPASLADQRAKPVLRAKNKSGESGSSQTRSKPNNEVTRRAERENRIIWTVVILFAICLLTIVCMSIFQNSFNFTQLFNSAPTPSSDELLSVINQNMRAANAENIDSYMATIHTKSPLYRQTEDALKEAFSTYNLSYSVAALRVEKQSSSEAEVHFVLTTKKISGPDFRDNSIEGVFIMRPEDGVWKIYQQEIIDVTYLN